MRLHLSFLLFFSFVIFLFFTTLSFAQQGRYDAFEMHFDNPSPSPGEVVGATLRQGSSSPFNIRSVRWFVNGEERADSMNELRIEEMSENTPKQIVANVTYFDLYGQRRFVQVIGWLRPVIFDIFWEGDGVVTPRYRGHNLAGPQVPIRISAKIQYVDENGQIYTEKDFSFRWEIESSFHPRQGPGVSSIVYEEGGTFLNSPISVRSEAFLINTPTVGFEKSALIPITKPRLLVYPRSLLHGLSDNLSLSRSFSPRGDFTASLYPFYFSRDDFEKNAVHYNWFVGNNQTPSKSGRKIDISTQGRGVSVPIQITAQNENKNLQKLSHIFNLSL